MGNRKTWAILLGTTAGVTMVTLAVTWYMKSHETSEPLLNDVQSMITDAYDKIKNLEQALSKWRPSGEVA